VTAVMKSCVAKYKNKISLKLILFKFV